MCGLDHLSNCHGEWAWAVMFVGGFGLWFRKIRYSVRLWWAEKKKDKHAS